jgi:hypothetical protein
MVVSGQQHATVTLSPGKDMRLGWARRQPGRFGEDKKPFPLSELESRNVQPVT